jgi:ABC-type Fe3+ transport system permease subunit
VGRDGSFSETFILRSEHKRVLENAQRRGDQHAKAEFKRGYWQGIAQTVWIVGFVALFALVIGFNVGAELVQ